MIKIDIEGAESEVIRDLVLSNKIKNSKRYIIEYHHKINFKKFSLADFIKNFEDFSFEYNLKTSFNYIGEFQNVLLYFYNEGVLNL